LDSTWRASKLKFPWGTKFLEKGVPFSKNVISRLKKLEQDDNVCEIVTRIDAMRIKNKKPGGNVMGCFRAG